MRLWLITALVALAIGQVYCGAPSKRIVLMPDYPDGTLITIYFIHDGYVHDFRINQKWRPKEKPEPAKLRFFDEETVSDPDWTELDMIEIIMDKQAYAHVGSNTRLNNEWNRKPESNLRVEQFVDREVPSKGRWKIEIYKLDDYNLNVFFDEYHSGVRLFDRKLGDTKSIYLLSDNVYLDTIDVTIKFPKDNIVPLLNVDQFYSHFNGESTKLIAFTDWPINGYIEMTVSMRVSKGSKAEDWNPGVSFGAYTHQPFLKVSQVRQNPGIKDYEYADTWLTSKYSTPSERVMYWSREYVEGQKWLDNAIPPADQLHDRCLMKDHHNGDIQHLRFERISTNRVKMQIYYKAPYGKIGLECIRIIPDEQITFINNPFTITSYGGAVVFHMTSSLTKTYIRDKRLN